MGVPCVGDHGAPREGSASLNIQQRRHIKRRDTGSSSVVELIDWCAEQNLRFASEASNYAEKRGKSQASGVAKASTRRHNVQQL
jgi:hypothetical protein